MYLLCASAYTAYDMQLFGAYPQKKYKWGYFPKVKKYDIERLIENKRKNGKIVILWAGRFLKWKHPEVAIKVAKLLKQHGYKFKLILIGDGELKENLVTYVNQNQLQDVIDFTGFMNPDEVRKHMEKADIFLFTSDYNEGWGAVLNEAMNSGCAVVASHAIGSVPFLIKHKINGMIYKNGDTEELLNMVMQLSDNDKMRENLGRQAYSTLVEEWNAENATNNFLQLTQAILSGEEIEISCGPCSIAKTVSQRKMYNFLREVKEHE